MLAWQISFKKLFSTFHGNQPNRSVADTKLQIDGSGLHVRHSFLTS